MLLENKILKTKLTWPTVYRMFAVLYANKKTLIKNASDIENRYLKGTEFKPIAYSDVPIADRAWLLFKTRTKDILIFCKRYGLENSFKAVLKYNNYKDRGPTLAVRSYYKDKFLIHTVTEVLEKGLQRQYKNDRWKVYASADGLLLPTLDIYRNSSPVASFPFTINGIWMSYSKISKKVSQ